MLIIIYKELCCVFILLMSLGYLHLSKDKTFLFIVILLFYYSYCYYIFESVAILI